MQKFLIDLGIKYPKAIMMASVILTIIFLGAFPSLKRDTDPVHMLPQDNQAVVLYETLKKEFNVNDMVVLGIKSKDGSSLFTPTQLQKIHKITLEVLNIQDEVPKNTAFLRFFRKLQFLKDHSKNKADREIFIKADVLSLSTVDDIVLNKSGQLLVQPMMKKAPTNDLEAKDLLKRINNNPMFKGKLVSKDGSLVGIYLPLKEGRKDRSYYLSKELERIASKHLSAKESFFIAGLPVAETTFGNEMFIQMGVYAPMAGLVIFLLLYFFFRNVKMILAPMMMAIMTVIWSMGGLIYAGQTIHIMSSMIPIFLMPIAVLDSVHILSTMHDHMNRYGSKEEAVRKVMNELFKPMLFTSITTFIGFVSLATTGIPPVIVFGVTVACGVLLAWLLSMVFIPAYIMILSEESLQGFGKANDDKKSIVMEVVQLFKGVANQAPRLVIVAFLITLGVSFFGLTKIIINDNPVRWFKADHTLRKADVVMNNKLAGTYMSSLYFNIPQIEGVTTKVKETAKKKASSDEDEFNEDEFSEKKEKQYASIRSNEVIQYINKVGKYLESLRSEEGVPVVGGVTSIVDVLRKVGTVAFNDTQLPNTRKKISQYMFLFESGDIKKGKDMWKFITPNESTKAQMWVQMKSGDNQRMLLVMNQLKAYMKQNPPPVLAKDKNGKEIRLEVKWSGLTYINTVWQSEMVTGMAKALAGSFVIVFLMMVVLFRSVKWGLIAMFPLSMTIVMIYGMIGFVGKFYDMPIAVLSSLTLGLSVDFAIHFIQHARQTNEKNKDSKKTFHEMFEGTAQAIWRNVLVISIGFAPLFLATLVPYVTVGFFFFGIMIVSGITTLILLPVMLKLFHKRLPSFAEYQ